MALTKIGKYIEIDQHTEAKVIGYLARSGNKYDGFTTHPATFQDGKWTIPHPTDDRGCPIEVDEDALTEDYDIINGSRSIKK